ncbi:hypothetical protein TIFTF001_009659 [Ficus carica]|uniref:Uncharacterized protein n=1 Tax=Ficus carica TaxID=3494 RepID=A0AA88D2T0_FICCA|nr:hypothetical protein TIFTF001_009659 [Ficus carica]
MAPFSNGLLHHSRGLLHSPTGPPRNSRGFPSLSRCTPPVPIPHSARTHARQAGLFLSRFIVKLKTCHKHLIPTPTQAASAYCNINPGPKTSSPAAVNPSLTTQGFMPTPTAAPQSSTQAGRRSKFTVRRSHN